MWISVIFLLALGRVSSADLDNSDESSGKILGSSVVTSVSVILDSENGNKATFSDSVGKPVSKPQVAKLASPIELLNPDRYEFYTFDEGGDLVKRLMTLKEIKAIIATSGDDVFNIDNFSDIIPENRVSDIVSNVQNVLREEIEAHKMPDTNQLFDTPDVSDSWSMILPAIFGNSGGEIKAQKTATASTPETLVIGPTETEASTSKLGVIETTIAPIPFSYFTNYFIENPTTETTIINTTTVTKASSNNYSRISTSKIPSTTYRVSTNKLFISQPITQLPILTQVPNKIPTDSTPLKVQILPNSNTNSEVSVSTFTVGGTIPDSEYVRIRTPKPQAVLESRISSATSKEKSPSINTKTSVPATTKFVFTQAEFSTLLTHPFTQTTNSISSYTTESTVENTTPEPSETEKENEIIRTPGPEIISHYNISTTSTSTEKIYILLRPLSSTTITTLHASNYSNQSVISAYTQNDSEIIFPSESASTQSIFTIIPQNPAIVSIPVLPPITTFYKKNSSESNILQSVASTSQTFLYQTQFEEKTRTNGFSNQPNNGYTISTFESFNNPFNTTTQSSLAHLDNNSILTTAGITNNKNSLNNSSSNYTTYTLQKVHVANTQPIAIDNTSMIPSIFSGLQNIGSVFNNQYSSDKLAVTVHPTFHSAVSGNEDIQTGSTKTNDVDAEITVSVGPNSGLQTDILNNLLLSSTNVYEINSAVNHDLIHQVETTSFSEEFFTELPNVKNGNDVEVNPTIIESFGQLLAQAVGNISDVTPKESVTYDYYHETVAPDSRTTSKFETSDPSTNFHDSTILLQDLDSTRSPTYVELTEETKDKTTEPIENISPSTIPISNRFSNFDREHVINMSIFRKENYSKPAKADLSLESDYNLFGSDTTEMKNTNNSTNLLAHSGTSTEDKTLPESTPQFENEQTIYFFVNKSGVAPQYSTLISEPTTHSEYTTDLEYNVSTVKITATPSTPSIETTLNTRPYPLNFNQVEDTWTLVSTIAPHGKVPTIDRKPTLTPILEPTPTVDLEVNPMQGFGLEESTAELDADVYHFVQLCNELAFGFWKSVTVGISTARSVIVSPFAATSLLAMVFLGARGSTSGEMNEILKLDNMVTFNPHLTFKTVTESILTGPDFGVATSAIVRQLYSDKSKERILNFYKERARFFYDGHVEEVSFKAVGDTIRRRTNLLIKKQTNGKIQEFLKDGSVRVRSPLAAISGSVMQTDCSKGSITDRDGEIHFVVFPSIKQRRLIPIPAIVYRKGFLAGYEPSLDATAVSLGGKDDIISFIFVLPGRQGINALGDGLSRLEKRLVESSFQKGAWARLLRTLIPRPELEVQIPRFSHRSIINATAALKHMGLTTLFDINKADLRGLNGVAHDLHLSDMLQFNHFSLCGSTNSAHRHHSEYYPATATRSLRKHRKLDHFEQQKILHDDPLYIINYLSLPLNLRPRQARVPQVPKLRLDRPFLYFVRHNPTGFILHMGRFNPRLLP